jgi:hypothetical protein
VRHALLRPATPRHPPPTLVRLRLFRNCSSLMSANTSAPELLSALPTCHCRAAPAGPDPDSRPGPPTTTYGFDQAAHTAPQCAPDVPVSYSPVNVRLWSRADSNRRPPACKAGALPTELRPHELNSPESNRISAVTITAARTVRATVQGTPRRARKDAARSSIPHNHTPHQHSRARGGGCIDHRMSGAKHPTFP